MNEGTLNAKARGAAALTSSSSAAQDGHDRRSPMSLLTISTRRNFSARMVTVVRVNCPLDFSCSLRDARFFARR